MNRIATAILALLLAAPPALATSHDVLSEGEIRRVDKEASKLTIRHGPLLNLDMPAMTMVFVVRDAALLDQVRPGDRVKFRAEKLNGGYEVTRIEAASPTR
jgi:Cu(I)/Ag(I) efflux system periplasmic protein CusF